MFTLYKYLDEGADPTDWDSKYLQNGLPAHDEAWYLAQEYVRLILRHISPGQSVLDAGCGTGGLLGFLQRRGFDVVGIDMSAQAVAIANRALPQPRVRQGSIEQPPFPDASFDAYLSIASWEYPEEGPERAAREAARVLKPSGVLVVVAPRANLLRRVIYLPLRRLHDAVKGLSGRERRFLVRWFSVRDLMRLLDTAGFDVLEVEPHDLNDSGAHFGLWVDWPFLRGGPDYRLNVLGRAIKTMGNALSPWTIATGATLAARRRA